MATISVPGYDTIDEVRMFYDQCVSFWQRQGDRPDVARCKAFWWDIVEIANTFDRWTPGKVQLAAELCGYRPGDPVPDENAVASGSAIPQSDRS